MNYQAKGLNRNHNYKLLLNNFLLIIMINYG